MIYITGDTHGEISRFHVNTMGDADWTEEDVLIVCGDFGFVFYGDEEDVAKLDALSEKPYTVCFCDGNHENFPKLYEFPEEEWCGGRVHRLRKNVLHLMRGQVFSIQGKTVFTMGGAYSVDRASRVRGKSWWEEELPCEAEYEEARKNLEKHGNRVDLVVTHTAPPAVIHAMGKYPDGHDEKLLRFFRELYLNLDFDRWYFGHWHTDWCFKEWFTAVYLDVCSEQTDGWKEAADEI